MFSFLARHAIPFAAGLICGGLLVSTFHAANQGSSSSVELVDEVPALEKPKPAVSVHVEEQSTQPNETVETATSALKQSGVAIPESYRRTIGPVVQPPTFGERFKAFEAEPIDGPWAQAMEAGMNNFVAAHGPDYGSVIEFIQCRTSICVIAGYTIPNHEGLSASIIGELRKQSWWQGGNSSSSNLGSEDGRTSFVILIDRYVD